MAEIESHYLFVEVAAQRCVQLMRGAKPKLDLKVRKPTTLAIAEVDAGLIDFEFIDELEAEEGADGDGGTGVEEEAEDD